MEPNEAEKNMTRGTSNLNRSLKTWYMKYVGFDLTRVGLSKYDGQHDCNGG